jgi:crossover junction endodeoxyribonuclease RuvC
MKIISIDPGYERVGVAIIEKTGSKEELIFSDCIQTSAKIEHSKRLLAVGQEVASLIEKYQPSVLATESLFFKNNQKTAMKVSEARGVVIYEAQKAGLKIFEYTPLQIKIATTGYGKSEKNQVMEMVKRLIKINKTIKYDDEYDAIAVGLTFFATDSNRVK